MERVLQVEEILHQVFDNLLPEFDMKRSFIDSIDPRLLPIPDKPTRATLLSAALTCRSFVEPALDALWWAMDDLRPLLSLLPSFKLDDDLPDKTYTISGPISKEDCLKFEAYSRKIKFFHLPDIRRVHVALSAYIQLSHSLGRNYILPSLWYLRCDHETELLLFLMCPCLRAFCVAEPFGRHGPTLQVNAFLNLMGQATPSLVCLGLYTSIQRQNLDAICRMPQLKYLALFNRQSIVTSINPDFFQAFSAYRTLSCLHLYGIINFPVSSEWPPDALCFPALTSIKVGSRISLAEITNLFRVAKFPRLEELVMSSNWNDKKTSVDVFPDFSKYLVQSTGFVIRSLDFGAGVLYSGNSKHGTSISTFSGLQRLPLTKFRMGYLNTISVADVKMIVDWWPNLQVLKISSLLPEKPRFDALILLAKGLPRLIRLHMELDCSHPPAVADVPLLAHPLRRLCLDMKTQHLPNPIVVALCIDTLFPNVRNVRETTVKPRDVKVYWEQCKECLSALQQARQQESLRKYPETADFEIDSDVDL